MKMVYLGLLSKVYEWVWSRILEPVVSFVAKLLGSVLEFAFRELLEPVLTNVMKVVLPWAAEQLGRLLSGLLYSLLSWFFKLIDILAGVFDVLIGAEKVQYGTKQVILLNALLSQPSIQKAFWIINGLGLGIAMLLCIYAVTKSTLDFDFENKRPVGAVLRAMFKCFISFLMIPLLLVVILNISGIIMGGIKTAFNSGGYGEAGSLGCILFAVTSLDASVMEGENISDVSAGKRDQLMTMGARGEFYSGKKDYLDKDLVSDSFDLAKFDYLVGIIIGAFLLIILVICALSFVRRIFEILILYLVSPLFVSTMPIDDGEKFKKWREMFISKIFGGYGSLMAMKLYLLVCPIIVGNSIQWGSAGTSVEASYFIKLIFLVGGAWATLKIGPMIATILDAGTGQDEMAITNMVTHSTVQHVSQTAAAGASKFTGAVAAGGQKLSQLGHRSVEAGKHVGSQIGSKFAGRNQSSAAGSGAKATTASGQKHTPPSTPPKKAHTPPSTPPPPPPEEETPPPLPPRPSKSKPAPPNKPLPPIPSKNKPAPPNKPLPPIPEEETPPPLPPRPEKKGGEGEKK